MENWQLLVSIVLVVGTILGVVVPLHIHLSSQTNAQIRAIQEEMKDFHGRLCAIEERNSRRRNIIEP